MHFVVEVSPNVNLDHHLRFIAPDGNVGVAVHIEALLPPHALEIARAAEVSERNYLLTMANIAGGRA